MFRFSRIFFDNVPVNATQQLTTTQLNLGQALYTSYNVARRKSPGSSSDLFQGLVSNAYAHCEDFFPVQLPIRYVIDSVEL